MIRATTPTFMFTIQSTTLDLTTANNIYVSIVQGDNEILKTGDDVTLSAPRTISVWLTQEESLALVEGASLEVQVNWTYLDIQNNVRRAATKPKSIPVTKQLLKRVIE